MSEPREAMTDAQRRAREAIERLPRVEADPAFRARLKREFAAGSIGATRRLEPRSRWRSGWTWALAPAAAAVVVVGAMVARGPDWTIATLPAEGSAVVNGREIPFGRRDELERALRRGGSLRLSGTGGLELMASGQMAVEVAPGSDATLPPPAGRWLGRAVAASVRSGQIRITTGQAFRGARLSVVTPEATVEVSGTTLAVIRESAGTCVCVMEGRVRMSRVGAPMAEIGAGMRRFVFNDGRAPEEAEMRPVEKVALGEMKARYSTRLR